MRFKTMTAALALTAVAMLAGCSATPAPEPSPASTTSGTITLPGDPAVPVETPAATPEPSPSSTTASAFPRSGVDPQGMEREVGAEERFLNLVGFGGESLLDEQGRTYASVIEMAEGIAPSADYLLNIVYAGCAEALADTVATPNEQMVQQIVNETAAALDYAVADEVVASGYQPVIRIGLQELCGAKFASLPVKAEERP